VTSRPLRAISLLGWNVIPISFPKPQGNPFTTPRSAMPAADGNPPAAWYREGVYGAARIKLVLEEATAISDHGQIVGMGIQASE